MAQLSDIHYAMNGEPTRKVRDINDIDKIPGLVRYQRNEKTGKMAYPQDKEWYLFKLVDSNKKGGVYIPNIDDVINPETISKEFPKGKVERIRLLSGVSSIWVKDQKEVAPEHIRQNGRSIQFPRGHKILRVAAHDTTMLETCRLSNSNVGNPFRVNASTKFMFFEYDFASAELEAFEKESYELEMAIIAKQEKPEQMRKHASFLGIRMINDIGERKSDEGVRREYVMYAKRTPDYFDKTRKNTELLEVSWLVKKAIADTLIDIGREPQKIFWSKGGGMIGVYPKTENPQDYLTNLAMTNTEEGRTFKEQLKQVVT